MTQEQTPLEKHVAKFGLTYLNQACGVVGLRIYTANDWEFTIQEGDGRTITYGNSEQGITNAWKFLTVRCEELNRNHPLQRGPRVLPPRTPLPPPSPKRKYQLVAIHTERLEDIDMLFEMVADWLEGFNGDQLEAQRALRYLQNTLFPERMPFCEDCGASNEGVVYRTEIKQAEVAQCFTCFQASYLQENGTPWPWAFYPGCCDKCCGDTDLVQVGTGVLCKKCKQEQEGEHA